MEEGKRLADDITDAILEAMERRRASANDPPDYALDCIQALINVLGMACATQWSAVSLRERRANIKRVMKAVEDKARAWELKLAEETPTPPPPGKPT
jgi:hypothetical protein